MLTCDWSTKVITLPKSELTLISGTSYSITVLYWFQLLRELNGSEDGMVMTVGEPLYRNVAPTASTPRIVDVINGYTCQVEDGLYSLNFINGNTNWRDVEIKNSVGVGTNNTTGFIDPEFLDFGLYNGAVTYDAIKGRSGTERLTGTLQYPSNNLVDTLAIDAGRFGVINFNSDAVVDGGLDFEEFLFKGKSHVFVKLDIEDSANVLNCKIVDCNVGGVLDGGTDIINSITRELVYFNGHIHHSSLSETVTLGGTGLAYIANCTILDAQNPPTINAGGSGHDLTMPNYTGQVFIENLTGAAFLNIGLITGNVTLKSTVTGGVIVVIGNGSVTDEAGNNIPTGNWNGCTVMNNTTSNQSIAEAVREELTTELDTIETLPSADEVVDGIIPFIYGK